jgi:hypothetical protein
VSLTVTAAGLLVTIAAWPALANVGGVAGSVGNVNGGPVAISRLSATSFAASFRCNCKTFFFRRFSVEVHARYDA